MDTASPSRQTTNTAVDLPKEGKDQIRPSPVNLPSGERVLKTDKVIHRLIQDCCRSPEKREEKNLAKNDWMIRRHCPYKKDMLVYSTHGRGRRRNRQRAQWILYIWWVTRFKMRRIYYPRYPEDGQDQDQRSRNTHKPADQENREKWESNAQWTLMIRRMSIRHWREYRKRRVR
jgi:hypothetical protein